MPFFSVIIPLFNKEAYIEDTLNSVLNQTFQDFEIIIVNDGSTDSSIEIVSKFEDKRIRIFEQENKGAPVARNFGVQNANSDNIALLDADDIWHNNHLIELKKLIDTFPDAGLFCMNYEIYYSENTKRPAHLNFKYDRDCILVDDFFEASITNCVAWTSAVGFNKNTFNKIGRFDTTLRTAQDLDLWIRFALKYNIAFNPTITMRYNLYIDKSLSKNEYNTIRYEFLNKYAQEEIHNKSLKKYLDINRYALAIRCYLNDELLLYRKLKAEIDLENLNWKQRMLLKLPKTALVALKSLQLKLIKSKMYITAYR